MKSIYQESLFLKQSVSMYCSDKKKNAKANIINLKFHDIVGITDHEMIDKIYDEFKIESPIISDSKSCTHKIIDDEIVEYQIPFSGDYKLFNLSPLNSNSREPHGSVKGDRIIVKYILSDNTKKLFEENHENILRWLNIISEECEKFNRELKELVEKDVGIRYKELNDKANQAKNL